MALVLTVLQQGAPPELESVRERERTVRLELEAAQSEDFYVVVDVAHATLELKIRGVVLERFVVRDVTAGHRLGQGSTGENLLAVHLCESSQVELPVDIVPGQPIPDDANLPEPGASLTIHCGPALSVRVLPESASGFLRGLRERFLMPGEPEVTSRVRIVLPDDEYSRFFYAMPPRSRWLFSLQPAASVEP